MTSRHQSTFGVTSCCVCFHPCGYPDALSDAGWMVEQHHIKPRSIGGSDDYDNTLLLCPNHHGMAHALLKIDRESGITFPGTRENWIRRLRALDRDASSPYGMVRVAMECTFDCGGGI